MNLLGEQVLLRVYLQSADRTPHTPTHERIVEAARKFGLAGATVLRGILGVGYHGVLKSSAWSLVQHVPVIVEMVDSAEKIGSFIRGPLNQIMIGGMATLERATVLMYRPGTVAATPASLLSLPAERSDAGVAATVRVQPGSHMTQNNDGMLLRIFIGESDRFENKPLHQAILQKVRETGLAGATVLRGSEGFGAHSVVHKSALMEMSADLPVVIEIVDERGKIQALLPSLEAMVSEGMITMEYVSILLYRHGK